MLLLERITSLFKLKVDKITPVIKQALDFATEKHQGQYRKFSKQPYIVHPIAVAELINRYSASYEKYEEAIAAALLHDVSEDCNVSISEIEDEFGSYVANLVKELTNSKNEINVLGKTEYMKKKLVSLSRDAFLLKLADRKSNMEDFPSQKMKDETIEILEYVKEHRKLSFLEHSIIDDILKICYN